MAAKVIMDAGNIIGVEEVVVAPNRRESVDMLTTSALSDNAA